MNSESLNEVPAAEMRKRAQRSADDLTAKRDRSLFNDIIWFCSEQAKQGLFTYTRFNDAYVKQLKENPRVIAKLEELGYAVDIQDTAGPDADVPYYKLTIMW